jgi:hypothetical protein
MRIRFSHRPVTSLLFIPKKNEIAPKDSLGSAIKRTKVRQVKIKTEWKLVTIPRPTFLPKSSGLQKALLRSEEKLVFLNQKNLRIIKIPQVLYKKHLDCRGKGSAHSQEFRQVLKARSLQKAKSHASCHDFLLHKSKAWAVPVWQIS